MQSYRSQLIIVFLAFACAPGGQSAAQESADLSLQPYVAYVARDGEHTRCGPSEKYYKTDPLKAGQEVEVYLETSDDWLGIRPPENSFCWLQSDQVQVDDDEITGTIVDSGAYSWIGTHLGRAQKYSWQVRLDVGEEVTIIGTARREGPDGEEFWYRIVPPAGEFRWLHRSQIVYSPEEVEQAKSDPKPKPTALPNRQLAAQKSDRNRQTTNREDLIKQREEAEATESEIVDVTEPKPASVTGLVQQDTPIGSGLAANTPPAPPSSSEQAGLQQSAWVGEEQQTAGDVLPAAFTDTPNVLNSTLPELRAVMPAGPPYRPQTDLVTATVEGLQLELSRAMAADATAIEIQPLRDRCAQLSTNGPDAINRGRAALLLRRIEEYQRVVAQRTNRQTASALTSGASVPSESPANTTPTATETTFDRQGWLVKVYSARPNAPPYAVTDSAGRTLSYVTPVPGINLRRYLNQEVGLYGRVAYDTSLETPHLIAEQAVRVRR